MIIRISILLLFFFNIYFSFAQTKKQVIKGISELQSLWQTGKLDEGLIKGEKLLKAAELLKSDSLRSLILNEIGIIYDYKGEYSKSLNCYFQAEKLIRKSNDLKNLAYIYSNIGLVYGITGEAEKALGYYHKSLYIRKKINDSHGISASFNNMAIVFMDQKKYEKAIYYYKKSLDIDIVNKDTLGSMDSYNNLGVCYMDLKNFSVAESYFQKALAIAKKNNVSATIQNANNNFATLYYNQGKYVLAREYINEGLRLAKENGNRKNISFCYSNLKFISQNENNFKDAYEYLKKENQIDRELLGESDIQETAKLEVKYEYEKKQEIEKEKLKRSKAEAKLNAILLIFSLFILLFVVFMSFFLFRKWKQANEQKKEISTANELLNEKNSEILQSINYAQRIQNALLPSNEKIKQIFEHFSLLYLPKDIISGDFYWTFETSNFQYIAVADCTGHGVPGALMNMICHNALNRAILEFNSFLPGEVLTKTREIVVNELSKKDENVNDGMDISLLAVEKTSGKVHWSGANNDLWILRKENQELITIKALNQPIGKHTQNESYQSHLLSLNKGDRLFLITDGFADQFGGEKNKKFKNSNFKNLLLENQSESIENLSEKLKTEFYNWKGSYEQIDDVCILSIEI